MTTSEKFIEEKDLEIPIWWKRLIAFVVDSLVIIFIYAITLWIIDLYYDIRLDKIFNPLLIIAPFSIFFYTIQEYLFNTTIGKSIFKFRVLSATTNGKPSLEDILIRAITRLIPINMFFFLTSRPIGLHDIISKTVVVIKV